MSRTVPKLLAGALALPLVLAGCGGQQLGEEASSDGPYRVFFTADMTGATATLSRALLSGMKVAVDDVNAAGGIGGRQVELIENNDQNDPTSAVSALQELINSGRKPDLVYPGGSSAVSLSLLPITTREEILTIGGTVASQLNDPESFPYHFGTAELTDAYVPPFTMIAEERGFEKVAMIFSNNPTGQAAEVAYREEITAAGLEFVSVGYQPDALDMTPQLEQLRSQNPDALIFEGYGTPVQYLMRSRSGMRWDVPSFSTQTSSTYPFVDDFSAAELEQVRVIQSNWTVDEGETPAEMVEFIDKVKALPEGDTLSKTGVRLPAVSAATFQLTAWAAEKNGGKTDTASIIDTFYNDLPEEGGDATPWVTDSKGPNPYRFTEENHFPLSPPEIFLYIEPGMYDAGGMYVPGKRS
ncbi:ABC transporter substrate-binding protein [Dietzia sp. ANT_WB102]|uniref:ABC transporter substrate-binding protein n=1 Tax=Dietzia sp. ANT_WB102 TaxID=2597345 RepID=UPI0011EF80F4|nr:ABC transporter substrate-binding protein [Dietzia sp. ANT_WB102]KAA0918447.1 amino acid ABC transporter substrate-binding protein [Dietzia sp. ANT_WB102]